MLTHELLRTGGRYGLATMCIGVGQGIATIIERIDGRVGATAGVTRRPATGPLILWRERVFGRRLRKTVAVRTMIGNTTPIDQRAEGATIGYSRPSPPSRNLTDAAASKLREITAEEKNPDVGLWVRATAAAARDSSGG